MGKDRLPTAETFEAYTSISVANNGASSVPLNWTGEPLADRLSEAILEKQNYRAGYTNITLAALGSYGILARDVHFLHRWSRSALPQSPMPIEPVEFRPELAAIKPNEIQAADPIVVASNLLELVEKIDEDATLYSPYVDSDLVQIKVTRNIRTIEEDLRWDIEVFKVGGEPRNLRIHGHQPTGVIINSTATLQKLPNSVPFTTDINDFDSGNTNMGLASTATQGEIVKILASYKDFRLVHSAAYRGWAHKKDVAAMPASLDMTGYSPVFYTAFFPSGFVDYNGKEHLFMPGDMALEKDGEISTFAKGETGEACITALQRTCNFTSLEKPMNSLGLLIAFSHTNAPYMWSHNDCAAWMRKAFRMAGFDIPKYSAGIQETLKGALGLEETLLDQLGHGLYVIGKPGHIWLAAVNKDREFRAYSMAFQIKDSEGKMQSPVGMCESTREAVATYHTPETPLQIFRLTK